MASTTAGTIIAATVERYPRLASISTCLSVEPSRQNRRRLTLSLVLTLLYSSRSRSQPEPASDQGSVHRFSIEFSYDNLNFSYHIRANGALSGSGANTVSSSATCIPLTCIPEALAGLGALLIRAILFLGSGTSRYLRPSKLAQRRSSALVALTQSVVFPYWLIVLYTHSLIRLT